MTEFLPYLHMPFLMPIEFTAPFLVLLVIAIFIGWLCS